MPCTKITYQPGKQKRTPLRNGEDISLKTNITVDDLNAPSDFRIMLAVYQCPKRLSPGILGLYLYRNKIIARTKEKVHLQRRVVTLVIYKTFS